MHLIRHMLSCLLVAVIVAINLNGVAMAANDIGHQTHCLDAFGEPANGAPGTSAHDHDHDHDGAVAQHTTPNHDHDTCLMHACPAISVDAMKLRAVNNDIFTKLSSLEQSLHVLEYTDGLKRPPKT